MTDKLDPEANESEQDGAERRKDNASSDRPDLVSPNEGEDELDPTVAQLRGTIERLLRRELVVARQELQAEFHSGPLPHTSTLEGYERVVPGSAKMIFDNFEEQGKHRRQMERNSLRWGNYRSFAGLACGLIVSLAFLVVSFLLIGDGHDVAGTILGTVDLVALVSVFVYGSQSLRNERIRKAEIMAGQDEEPQRPRETPPDQ